MDMSEWMYKISRASNDLTFLQYVRKFVAAVKSIVRVWVGSAPYVHAIGAITNWPKKIAWCNLT